MPKKQFFGLRINLRAPKKDFFALFECSRDSKNETSLIAHLEFYIFLRFFECIRNSCALQNL